MPQREIETELARVGEREAGEKRGAVISFVCDVGVAWGL